MDLKQHIRNVPDFPKPGILFYDISTLLGHADAWQHTVHRLADTIGPLEPDLLERFGSADREFLAQLRFMTPPAKEASASSRRRK